MRIRNPFNAVLSNPFADVLLAAKAAATLYPLVNGIDHTPEFLRAAAANNTPVTSIPRGGLLSFISPRIQATPDQFNQERIAIASGQMRQLSNFLKLRSTLGAANYAALRTNPRYASMFANAPDFAAPLPGQTK